MEGIVLKTTEGEIIKIIDNDVTVNIDGEGYIFDKHSFKDPNSIYIGKKVKITISLEEGIKNK